MDFLDKAKSNLLGSKANMPKLPGVGAPKVTAPKVEMPKGPSLNIPLEPSPARKKLAVVIAEKKKSSL